MAFAASGLNCVAVGPTKLYLYYTTDSMTSATIKTDFDTTNCPGMAAGDVVIVAHNTNALLSIVRITDIDATSCQIAYATAP
jgi:hypothetical protein